MGRYEAGTVPHVGALGAGSPCDAGRGQELMTDETYDVVVVGAGPAGAAAAILLSQRERSVALIDSAGFPREDESSAWLSAQATPLVEQLGVNLGSIPAKPFQNVTFFSADFAKTATPAFAEPAGYLVRRGALDNALVDVATSAGVTLVQNATAKDVQLGESNVDVLLDGDKRVSGRLLILAAGRGSPLLARCGFARPSEAPLWTAQVDARITDAAPAPEPRITIVLGLDRGGSFGLICHHEDRVSASVNWGGEKHEASPTLINLCKMAYAHEIIPVDVGRQAAAATVVASPASAALDMDTHVGKHTLLIGDAGGFVSAASNEGVYPAMWSAEIATEVAHAALDTPLSQDELMSFNSKWRIKMADYLRSPNTDPQFLLPLVFSNQAMADRMGAAFFSGENI